MISAALALSLFPVRNTQADDLRVEIFYLDATTVSIERVSNRRLRFDTAVGTQTLELNQVKRLFLGDYDQEQVTVETVAGDTWVATMPWRALARLVPLYSETFANAPATNLVFYHENPPTLAQALDTRITLEDGSHIVIDGGQTGFRIRHDHGEWSIPLAAPDAFSFAVRGAELMAGAWFNSERLFLRGIVLEKELSVQDRFGRTLKIPVERIRSIRTIRPYSMAGSADAAAGTMESSTPPEKAWNNRESISLLERRTNLERSTTIATTVWTLETKSAKLPIPSPLVSRVASDPLSGETVIWTVAGERLSGALRADPLLEGTTDESLPPRLLAPAVLDDLRYERQKQEPADNWAAWRLANGDVFYGRFTEQETRIEASGRDGRPTLVSSDILQAERAEESGNWILHTGTGQHRLHARARSVDVIMAVNGTRQTFGWDEVESIQPGRIAALPPSTLVSRNRRFAPDAVRVEGGEFSIGRLRGQGMPDELPPVNVRLSAFFMDATPATRSQFAAFVRDEGYQTEAESEGSALNWRNPGFPQRGGDPVVWVSWFDAARFCNWRSRQAGLDPVYEFPRRGAMVLTHRHRNGFRLPTEAEWEYAARAGGRDILYPWGDSEDNLAQMANLSQIGDVSAWPWTTPVKSYPSNPLGLYDMAGNVWEWCEDWYYAQAYQTVFRLNPVNPVVPYDSVPGLTHRVMRGGSFRNDIEMLRCAGRAHGLPSQSADRVGFRTVRNTTSP